VQCSLLVLWKQLVSGVGTREQMCYEHVFRTLIMSVPNECPVVDCSRRPDQPHKMPGCRVVALFWVRPNHHEQRNGVADIVAERVCSGRLFQVTGTASHTKFPVAEL